ncbi:MAG: DUF3800 domain-containing protein [Phycisphaerae bacterium]|nr:DUF3800 domain-containing protein [Phycisphaerae bacterium]
MGRFRIYVDESGTHAEQWFIIGMLFVPDHGTLHSALVKVKEKHKYYNQGRGNNRLKESHLNKFRNWRDLEVAKEWINVFIQQTCYFRAVVIDWTIWNPKHFGDPFEPEALKRKRAYKKWAEMLLHPELKNPRLGVGIYHAELFLDRVQVLAGYDILGQLQERFTANYRGESPYIDRFELIDSWRDASQCLQLCDLLTGCIYQSLVPAKSKYKLGAKHHLAESLRPVGVQQFTAGFWKGFAKETLSKRLPKFSAWFWKPSD